MAVWIRMKLVRCVEHNYVYKKICSVQIICYREEYCPFWMLKIGILFIIQSLFVRIDLNRKTTFLDSD